MDKKLKVIKALADTTRLKIIILLLAKEHCVCQLQRTLCMSQPRVSRHLSILKMAGLINSRREGKMIFFFIINSKKNQKILEFVKKNK
ncbi:MAG: ArsR/SmtB family transcription factor [bacterium]